MNRDEIYDHLAQVYLGKRKGPDQKKKKQLNAWLLINIVITVIIFASIFYGLTAFFAQKDSLTSNVIYSLHNGPIRINFDLKEPFPPVKTFSLSIPETDLSGYNHLRFTIRSNEAGTPGIMKIVVKNKRNETSSYYVRGIEGHWQDIIVPFEKFKQITDWTSVTDISFVLESWNVEVKKGSILIDDLCFAKKY